MNILAQWGGIWGFFTLMNHAPQYFKLVHGWDIKAVSRGILNLGITLATVLNVKENVDDYNILIYIFIYKSYKSRQYISSSLFKVNAYER